MNKITFLASLIAFTALFISSCEKPKPTKPEIIKESTLTISIVSETKSSTSQTQTEDNTVNTVDVFVFRNTAGADNGVLDAHKRFSGAELGDLSALTLTTTTGQKNIYIVANAHKTFTGVITLTAFQNQLSTLQSEKFTSWTMIGNTSTTLGVTTSITLTLSRLVGRVALQSLKTNFTGTPWAGQTLTNVKLYLINVKGDKLFHNGGAGSTEVILNKKQAVAVDINNCTQTGLLYDDVATAINDAGYSTEHFFYAYENSISTETASEKFTKLIIQGDLNGITYYYPISVNQTDFGYNSANGHYGIRRNTTYTINVTINRPGSTDPDQPLLFGTLTTSVLIGNWQITPAANLSF